MIVVTGAAGFIGGNLARKLLASGHHDLLMVDHPTTAAKASNFAGMNAFRFVEHVAFLELLEEGRIDPEVVFHLGACSDTTEQDWLYLRRNNLEYTRSLWHWCTAKGRLFIYASSAATYGDGSLGFDDTTRPESLRPLNLYGRSKNDFDAWALQQEAAGEPTPNGWAGLKFFNVYGPGEGHKGRMASMVWHGYRQIRERGVVELFKSTDPSLPDGGQRRDFVYVDDCVDHMIWLWGHPEVRGIFNSGSGQARSFNELVAATFRALGREPVIRYVKMPEDLRGRYQNFTQARMGKLAAAGYPGRPTPLEDGVRRYIQRLLN